MVAGASVAITLLIPCVGPTLEAQQVVAAATDNAGKTPSALDAKVTLDLHKAPLRKAVQAIAEQAELKVAYGDIVDRSERYITLKDSAVTAREALDAVLRGTGITYRTSGRQVILGASTDNTKATTGIVKGKVLDAKTKTPLKGVTVQVAGQKIGMITDADGAYRIVNVGTGTHTLTAKRIGYGRVTHQVTITDDEPVTVDFLMDASPSTLDQVIVTGTVVATELKAVPNAMTVITAKDIEKRGITRIDQLFRGDVPGLFTPNSGTLSNVDSVTIFSRGATKLSSSTYAPPTTPMKTYVDGVELANSSYITQIDPASIERIEILTGPQASTIYGSNAINGVIQIFTKRGTTSRPQFTASLISGFIQNSSTTALTPQHDAVLQMDGMQGTLSYSIGGSRNFLGAWSDATQITRLSAFGSGRLQSGALTVDGSWRKGNTRNAASGTPGGNFLDQVNVGTFNRAIFFFPNGTSRQTLDGGTYGVNVNYAIASQWSAQVGYGSDESETQKLSQPFFSSPYDTSKTVNYSQNTRRTLHANTTMRVPIGQVASMSVTTGADEWEAIYTTSSASGNAIIGSLNATGYSRQPAHNTGAFVQSQLDLGGSVFLTYGLRAEWNPNYGKQALPNYAPRYGIAWTVESGDLTAKVRASYGRSTRPPEVGQKTALPSDPYYTPYFGVYDQQVSSPSLGPEGQRGGEGGLELYLGTRASLVVTRYDQMVNNLITSVAVDSVRSFKQDPYGYCIYGPSYCGYMYNLQYEYLNVGTLRNQGWELQGSTHLGPLNAKTTYSWTKSRMVGLTPAFANQFPASQYPALQPGVPANSVPEHTWALILGYSMAATNLSLNVNRVGYFATYRDAIEYTTQFQRLQTTSPRIMLPMGYVQRSPAYATADLNGSQRLTKNAEFIVQVLNVQNYYHNDVSLGYPVMGRQSKAGLRLRF